MFFGRKVENNQSGPDTTAKYTPKCGQAAGTIESFGFKQSKTVCLPNPANHPLYFYI